MSLLFFSSTFFNIIADEAYFQRGNVLITIDLPFDDDLIIDAKT